MMRSLRFLALVLTVGTVACGNSDANQVANPNAVSPANPNDPAVTPTTPPANGPTTRIMGRTQNNDPNGPIISWPGTKLYAGFTGTSLTVNLTEPDSETYNGAVTDNYFDVYVDGGAATVVKLSHGVTSYKVASGLQDGNHQIVMSKRTESDMGAVQYSGFVPEAGAKLIPANAPQTHMIEFIGDSATAGYGADGNVTLDNMCAFTPATEEADKSYALQTGAYLQADVHDTSYSGKGIYQNRDAVGDPVLTLPVLWTRSLGDTDFQAVTWDTNSWVPQAVVVIVGGNDFAASVPTPAQYNTVAVKFLQTLRAAYPQAHLFVAVSPMARGTYLSATDPENIRGPAEAYAQAMVSTSNSNGDQKVHYIALPEDDGSRLWGCDQHLTISSGLYFGNLIAQSIASQLGWTVKN